MVGHHAPWVCRHSGLLEQSPEVLEDLKAVLGAIAAIRCDCAGVECGRWGHERGRDSALAAGARACMGPCAARAACSGLQGEGRRPACRRDAMTTELAFKDLTERAGMRLLYAQPGSTEAEQVGSARGPGRLHCRGGTSSARERTAAWACRSHAECGMQAARWPLTRGVGSWWGACCRRRRMWRPWSSWSAAGRSWRRRPRPRRHAWRAPSAPLPRPRSSRWVALAMLRGVWRAADHACSRFHAHAHGRCATDAHHDLT